MAKCLLPLEDYVRIYPIVTEGRRTDLRTCLVCKKQVLYKNGIFFMFGARESIFVCRFCLDKLNLKKLVKPKSLEEPIHIWDLASNIPHQETDKLRIVLKDSKIFVEIDFNPSVRKKRI